MAMVAYRVAPNGKKWMVTRDGASGLSYVSQEAAYEVAVAEAAGDLRIGHEIRIEVLGAAYQRAGEGSHQAFADNAAAGIAGQAGVPAFAIGAEFVHPMQQAFIEFDAFQCGNVGVNAAVANAVFHATGVRVQDLPIRLEKAASGVKREKRVDHAHDSAAQPASPRPRARCGPPSDALGGAPARQGS